MSSASPPTGIYGHLGPPETMVERRENNQAGSARRADNDEDSLSPRFTLLGPWQPASNASVRADRQFNKLTYLNAKEQQLD